MPDKETTPLVASGSSSQDSVSAMDKFWWIIFHTLRLAAVLISLAMIVAQGLTLVVLDEGVFEGILRLYIFVFCVLFMLAELEYFQDKIPFLVGWIHRGVMYSFIGVIGVEEASNVKITRNAITHKVKESFVGRISATYVWTASVVMFCLGLVYMLLGAFCLRKVYDRIKESRSTSGSNTAPETV